MGAYEGQTDGGQYLSADKPFLVLGWPTREDARQFDSEREARSWVADECRAQKLAACARMYGFSNGKWKRLY